MLEAEAPGKIILAGEYAVLEGAPCVVMAIDRRARARLAKEPVELSPFLQKAAECIAAVFGQDSDEARAARRVVVDSSALSSESGQKLGLGSSAAATVAAVACALAQRPGSIDRELVHRLAHRAHGQAQAAVGARGSGADVAAAVYGGILCVRRIDGDDGPVDARPLRPIDDLVLVPVWTGLPAHTPSLVRRVAAFGAHSPAAYRSAIEPVGQAAAQLVNAFSDASASAAVRAIEEGARAIAELGRVTGAALWLPIHDLIAEMARRRGGAAKCTGAGGGDLAIAAFASAEAADGFRDDVKTAGMIAPELSVDFEGVRLLSNPAMVQH